MPYKKKFTKRRFYRRKVTKPKAKKQQYRKKWTKKTATKADGVIGAPITTKRFTYRKKSYLKKLSNKQVDTHGVTIVKEHGGTTSYDNNGFFGHCTTPVNTTLESLCLSLAKLVCVKGGFHVANVGVDLQSNYEINVGSNFTLSWEIEDGQTFTPAGSNYTTISGSKLLDVAHKFQTDIEGSWASNPDVKFRFTSLKFNLVYGAGNEFFQRVYVNLKDSLAFINARSYLKIQNRTLSMSNSTETDVINTQPLIGKAYFGRGNGAILKDHANAPANPLANPSYGIIDVAGGSQNQTAEPPSAYDFDGIRGSGGFSLKPGEIKTSYLKYSQWHKLDNVMELIRYSSSYAKQYGKRILGNYRFMAIERLLQSTYAEQTPDITVAYEVQLNLGTSIRPVLQDLTSKYIDQSEKL